MRTPRADGRRPVALPAAAIVFDCDGVLVDSMPSAERCWRAWAGSMGLDADLVLRSSLGQPSRAMAERWLAPDRVDVGVRLIDEMEIADASNLAAIPGADALVRSLPAGTWGVVTSAGRPLFMARVRAAGLPVPAVTVTADDISNGKPHPEGYATAMRTLGVPPDHAVVVEDSVFGIRAARAAGARWVVRVGPGGVAAGEDVVVPDLTALRWTGRGLEVVRPRVLRP